MEDFVVSVIDDVLSDTNVCSCEQCKMDIVAIALNNLPPYYFVTEKGQLFSKTNILRQQFKVDVISAIANAAKVVKAHPRHESSDESKTEKFDFTTAPK